MAKPPIRIKRSAVSGAIPTTAQLALGELAINTADGKVFLKKDDGVESIVEVGAGGGGSYTPPSALALYEKNNSGTPDSFDGVETRFQLRDTAGNPVTIASALLVAISVNGVVQKPNTGAPSSPFEGFYITNNASAGYDIVFDTAPSSGSDFFGVLAGTFTATAGTSGIKVLDDISSQFNGTLTDFTLQYNAANYTTEFPDALIISLGGVVQIPNDAYSISGSTISFTAAPPTGTSFYALSFEIGQAVDGVTEVTATTPISSTGGTTPVISIQDGTTTQKGAVQLEDSTSSTSTTTAATPNSVKTAYDLADAALPKSGGTMTGDIVFNAGQTIDGYVSETSSTGSAQLPSGTTAERDGSPAAGYIRYNTETGSFEGYGTAWGAIGGGAAVTTGETAPSNPSDGDLWYDTSTSGGGRTYVYYDDGNTSQWVDAAPQGAGGPYGLGSASAPSITFLNDSNTGIYSPGADQLALSTSGVGRVFVDASGRVAIGRTPVSAGARATFAVDGTGGSDFYLFTNGTEALSFQSVYPNTTINYPASGNIYINKGGSTVATLDSSGRLGINVTSPAAPLDLSGDVIVRGTNSTVRFKDSGNTTQYLAIYGNSTDANINAGVNNLVFYSAGTERARFDGSGRLLVGTSSSTAGTRLVVEGNSGGGVQPGLITLAMSGNTLSDGSALGALLFSDNSHTQAASITARRDGGTWTSGSSHPTRLVFSTTADGASSPTERMRIQSTGTILIGKTSSDYNSAGIELAPADWITVTNDGLGLRLNRTGSDGEVAQFMRSGTIVGRIEVTTTSTSYNTSSDYRLKENIEPVSDGITRLQQLKPSRFNFIADPDKTVDGFIAHEVQAVVPEAISGEKDGEDDEGNPIYQGIDQSKLVPLLTAALQEAIGRIESLEAEVAALKAQ